MVVAQCAFRKKGRFARPFSLSPAPLVEFQLSKPPAPPETNSTPPRLQNENRLPPLSCTFVLSPVQPWPAHAGLTFPAQASRRTGAESRTRRARSVPSRSRSLPFLQGLRCK